MPPVWWNINTQSIQFTRNPSDNSWPRGLPRSVQHKGIMDSGSEMKVDETDTCNPFEPRRLDFDPQSFVNVGCEKYVFCGVHVDDSASSMKYALPILRAGMNF